MNNKLIILLALALSSTACSKNTPDALDSKEYKDFFSTMESMAEDLPKEKTTI